jgi:hypothetical protein
MVRVLRAFIMATAMMFGGPGFGDWWENFGEIVKES